MKKVFSVLGFLILSGYSVIAQDTLTVVEVADTLVSVAGEAISSLPGAGVSWREWSLWVLALVGTLLGLFNFFKGKKVVVK